MKKIPRLFQKSNKTAGGAMILEFVPNNEPPKIGFSDAPAEWRELRESHYKKWFGDSTDALVWHEVPTFIPHIDVHVFSPSEKLGRNYFTLITSGMSDEKMTLPERVNEQYARAELVFYIPKDEAQAGQIEKPWYVNALFFFAHFPFKYKTWLGFYHTLPNGNPPEPIIKDSLLTTAFFLPAIFEQKEFEQNFKLGDQKVNLLWLTYLSNKETEYKLKHGYKKLVEKLSEEKFPQVFDPFRKSII